MYVHISNIIYYTYECAYTYIPQHTIPLRTPWNVSMRITPHRATFCKNSV